MSAQHTQGKLVHCKLGYPHADIKAANGRRVAITWDIASNQPRTKEAADRRNAESRENARRLVACWNACEGISTESLESGQPMTAVFQKEQSRADRAEVGRDELMAALKRIDSMCERPIRYDSFAVQEAARAAIAKADGGAA